MKFLVGLGVILLIMGTAYLVSKWSGKLLGVEGVDLEKTAGGKVYKWGCIILFGIYLVVVISVGIVNEQDIPNSYFLFFIAALWLLKALVEWKYIKGSKQYIRTLIELIFIMIAIPLAYNILSHFSFI